VWEEGTGDFVKTMKKQLVDLNNQFVTKKRTILGSKFKVSSRQWFNA
jgi:hypothetical protein